MSVPRITKEDLKLRLDAGDTTVALVDARLKYPYEHSTLKLPGAIRYAGGDQPLAGIGRDRELVVYDSDPDELNASTVALDLKRQGYRVTALKGGLPEWVGASFPVEAKEAPRQAPPQPGALKG